MTTINNKSNNIALLFELVTPDLMEFGDYRINGALKAAQEEHKRASDFIGMIARMSASGDNVDGVPWEHDTGDGLGTLDSLIAKAREITGDMAQEPAEREHLGDRKPLEGPIDFDLELPATPAEETMFDLLCRNFDAWDDEEDSVKEEHDDLIAETDAFIEAYKARSPAAPDLRDKALQDCVGALGSCLDQIGQMRGMFDDEDGTIQQAVDDAEGAQASANAAIVGAR